MLIRYGVVYLFYYSNLLNVQLEVSNIIQNVYSIEKSNLELSADTHYKWHSYFISHNQKRQIWALPKYVGRFSVFAPSGGLDGNTLLIVDPRSRTTNRNARLPPTEIEMEKRQTTTTQIMTVKKL